LNYKNMDVFNLKVIKHSLVTKEELGDIIQIKSQAWPYPATKQIEWIKNNLKESDFHILLLKDNHSVAYLNLVDIELFIDDEIFRAFGVGNVCAFEKGKGYGNELMKRTNRFILEHKKIGLLFCKKELIQFYSRYKWHWVNKEKSVIRFNTKNPETMIFNINKSFNFLTYEGNIF